VVRLASFPLKPGTYIKKNASPPEGSLIARSCRGVVRTMHGLGIADRRRWETIAGRFGPELSISVFFPNPEGQLLPGMSVRVQVQEGVRAAKFDQVI
jgi:hypothetical protein